VKDPGYLAWLRTQRCVLGFLRECFGAPVAHHHTHGRGMGQKASDRRAMPFCTRHHDDFHNARGHFKTMKRQQRRDFQDEHCGAHWAAYSRAPREDVF